jgi:hypothetical protein
LSPNAPLPKDGFRPPPLRGGAFNSHEKNVSVSVHAGGPGSVTTGFRVLREMR